MSTRDASAISDAEAFERAGQALADSEAAGGQVVDRTGRRRSPITMPEFRLGRAPANKGKTYPVEVLTAEEVQALLDAFPSGLRSLVGSRSRALVVLLWRSGLRIAEALALFPKDVDLEHGVITVLRGKGAKRRLVGVDALAVDYLRDWMRHRQALGIELTAPLFCTCSNDAGGRGRPLGSASVREQLKRYGKKAGIAKRVHPHGLRHTHAYELSMESVPLNVIRGQLGHTSLEMTQHYIDHLAPAAVVLAIRERPWPGGVVPSPTTWATASQTVRVPLKDDTVVAALAPIPTGLPPSPVVKLPHGGGAPRGANGEAKDRILGLIKANGGRATQAQLCRALRVSNVVVKRHCEQLAAGGHLARRRMARPDGAGTPLVIWMLPPLKAIYKPDPRVELGTRARNGHGPARVLDAIKAAGGRASQAHVAGVLGLTTGTIAKHCQALEARGELVRGGLDHATANRGSQVWALPPRERYNGPAGLRLQISAGSSSTSR